MFYDSGYKNIAELGNVRVIEREEFILQPSPLPRSA